MTTSLAWLTYGLALAAIGFVLASMLVASEPPLADARAGHRGIIRARSIAAGGVMRWIDPLVRHVAAWLPPSRLGSLGVRAEEALARAGSPHGWIASELVATAIVMSTLATLGALLACAMVPRVPIALVPLATMVGAAHPLSILREARTHRERTITRALPGCVEVMALCMSAGMDFVGAVRTTLSDAVAAGSPLHDELTRMLEELQLGSTRSAALARLAERVPTRPVRDLVNAALRAEEKGSPLADALAVQASVLRQRRGVAVEEAAARASLALLAPLTLVFGAIMLLVLGPMALSIAEGL
ncbi:type II secretion system F family protein [Sandaracinus amylolyticus]|uniref:type II secretion system F family protein n=1 Tax=Sandaracinus amylolyticus TaxID=927083 RepID=UPI001F1C9090|nr:type II secretion system F family protein [Sandaracinus amylolyticus]UJR83809.1 Hypothetical protein I5071_58800 [Sandaracinus amylolyticus]